MMNNIPRQEKCREGIGEFENFIACPPCRASIFSPPRPFSDARARVTTPFSRLSQVRIARDQQRYLHMCASQGHGCMPFYSLELHSLHLHVGPTAHHFPVNWHSQPELLERQVGSEAFRYAAQLSHSFNLGTASVRVGAIPVRAARMRRFEALLEVSNPSSGPH